MQSQATDNNITSVGTPTDAAQTGVETAKQPFVQPKLTFVQPKLTRQGTVADTTQTPPPSGFINTNFSA